MRRALLAVAAAVPAVVGAGMMGRLPDPLGRPFESGWERERRLDREALRALLAEAEAGDADAQVVVAAILEDPRDDEAPVALIVVAEMLVDGVRLPRDLPRARDLLRRAAEGGNPGAMGLMGDLHRLGQIGAQTNAGEAARWYRLAYDHGAVAQAGYRLHAMHGAGEIETPPPAPIDDMQDSELVANAARRMVLDSALATPHGPAAVRRVRSEAAWLQRGSPHALATAFHEAGFHLSARFDAHPRPFERLTSFLALDWLDGIDLPDDVIDAAAVPLGEAERAEAAAIAEAARAARGC